MLKNREIKLERANFSDAVELSHICKKAFDREMILYKDGKIGGPKHYDDPKWHIYSMKEGVYHKILFNLKLIGGIIIAIRDKKIKNKIIIYHWELVQMFIHPDCQNKGIGSFAVKQMEEWFPEMYKFTTGTPSFSIGNIHFYEKLGFKKIGEQYCEDEDINIVLFEKLYK